MNRDPQRLEGESFEEYKKRRAFNNRTLKLYKQTGNKFYLNVIDEDKLNARVNLNKEIYRVGGTKNFLALKKLHEKLIEENEQGVTEGNQE